MKNELAIARKEAITSLVKKIILCIAAGVLGALCVKNEGSLILSFLGFVIFAGIAWYVVSRLSKNTAYARFVTLYKSSIIQSALNGGALYEDMEFEPDCGLSAELVNSTGMITANKFFSNCFLSGTYSGIQFCQAEVRNVRVDRNSSSLEYDGTLITFPTALPEAGRTNIFDKQADIAVVIPGSMISSGNAEFDAAFKVSSNDNASAQRLITSDFMHYLMSIRQRLNRKIVLTIHNGRMFVFLTGKQSVLKPNLFKKYDDSMKSAVVNELNAAKLFIDAFGAPANPK